MKIAIIAGSNRSGATSTRLCQYIGKLLQSEGIQIDLIDLYEQPVPFYCPDDEERFDENLTRLKRVTAQAHAIVLATPEYHGGISGVLKNALDHLGSEHFGNKPVLSVSSSGGAVGVSSLSQLQTIVRNLHGINSPEWISIGSEQRKFNAEGMPEYQATRDRVQRTLQYFVQLTKQLSHVTNVR